jgi:hypothetical protein
MGFVCKSAASAGTMAASTVDRIAIKELLDSFNVMTIVFSSGASTPTILENADITGSPPFRPAHVSIEYFTSAAVTGFPL